jgi:hypothetical protein
MGVRLLKLLMLSMLLGASALIYAQDEKPQEEPKSKQEEPKKQDEAKPAKPDKQDEKMQKQDDKQMQKEGQPAQPRAGNAPSQAGAARPAGKGGRIPDDKFRSSFGRSHSFKAQGVIVSGQQQFQYGGYSFQLVDAWPVGWAYTDDCYIDYIDGEYFLFDLLHPGVRIAVVVIL